jgi:hypothetical protein
MHAPTLLLLESTSLRMGGTLAACRGTQLSRKIQTALAKAFQAIGGVEKHHFGIG